MRCILEEKQIYYVIADEVKEEDRAKFTKDDLRAKSMIVACITDKHLDLIKDAQSVEEMFETLNTIFERKSVFTKLYLRRQLLTLKYKENEKMEEYFQRFESLIREIENSDKKLDEDERITYLLLGLPDKFNTVVTALETLNEKITLDFVKARLLDEELKLRTKPDSHGHTQMHDSSTSVQINI